MDIPLLLLVLALSTPIQAAKPHLFMVLQDDLGHHDIGFNNPEMLPISPHITALAQEGIILSNHLVHFHCSPTRRTFLSGRWPLHHGEQLSGVATDDLDLRWTLLPAKLKAAGYATHWVGKGHTGFMSVNHLPTNRGFDSYLGFLSGSQSYYSDDRWMNANPYSKDTNYSTILFGEHAIDIVKMHSPATPLFMYLAWQAVHSPYDAVPNWDNTSTLYPPYPGVYAGMISEADNYTGQLVTTIKDSGMWDNSLIVYCSDNGGVSENHLAGINYPLRGEKHSNWRGGYRVAAFISGGLIPPHLRQTHSNLRIHIADWYPTFCNLAGVNADDNSPIPPLPVDPSNPRKDIYGNTSYPGVDGVDVWRYLITAPSSNDFSAHVMMTISAQVLLVNATKLLLGQGNVGDSGEKTPGKDGWRQPNGTWITAADVGWKCGLTYLLGDPYIPCLFDESDLSEKIDLSPNNESVVTEMWQQLNLSLLTAFTARSPAALLGPCNQQCAQAYWKSKGGSGDGPICGVPGCTEPSPSPSPPPPSPPPSPPGPFTPINATNCTFVPRLGSHMHATPRTKHVATTSAECCSLCFQSSTCVLSTYHDLTCTFHDTMVGTLKAAADEVGCVTGRMPLPLTTTMVHQF